MPEQTQFDVVDMHHARVDSWLNDNHGKQPGDLFAQFVAHGASAFFFKASEGRKKDPRFRDLVSTAHDLGISNIGAYHVNLRGDAGMSRVDEECDNFLDQIDGLPIDVLMIDWETWEKKQTDGTYVARTADDKLTGGTVDQTVRLLTKLEEARPTKVFLYAGLPMIPRKLNDNRLRSFPLVYPDYRRSSTRDPADAAAHGGIADAAARMIMHQWGGSHGVLGFDSNRIVDRPRFDAAFAKLATGGGGRKSLLTDLLHGQFGLFPLNLAKPPIKFGDRGDLVLYAQSVIFFKAGGGIPISGDFDIKTQTRVTDLQRVFALPQDGEIDRSTWGAIDFLTAT